MKLPHKLAAWALAALLAGALLGRPLRLVRSLYRGDAFDALALGLEQALPVELGAEERLCSVVIPRPMLVESGGARVLP